MPQSPWSLKTTWALRHARVDYTTTEYSPSPISDLFLRLKLRRRQASVPVMFFTDGSAPLTDGFDIVRWADLNRAHDVPSLLDGHGAEMREWEELAQAVMVAERCVRTFCSQSLRYASALPAHPELLALHDY
jgi:glutathione S-transferase